MNTVPCTPLHPPVVSGTPYERGRQIAEHFAAMRDLVRKKTESVVKMRNQGGEQAWLSENLLRLRVTFPEVVEYLTGQADGFQVPLEDLFATSCDSLMADREKARRAEKAGEEVWENECCDECSTFAFPVEGAGALAAKNRDNPTGASARHTIVLHQDPAWDGGWVLAVSTAGGAMATSSGINSHGLAMVINAARPRQTGSGFLKAHIADVLLSRCRSVQEAVSLIQPLRFMGEGNMILTDKSGAVVAMGFGGGVATLEQPEWPGWVARTNHFVGAELEALNQRRAVSSSRRRNSNARLERLHTVLGELSFPWSEGWENAARWAADQLCFQDPTEEATICWDNEEKYTSSAAIYRCDPPALLISEGPPSRGIWRFWQPPAHGSVNR